MSDEITKQIHVFEKAKLGKAPYTFLRMDKRDSDHPGACDFCGKEILYTFHLESSDGYHFTVGSDCILKSDDNGLIKVVTTKKKEIDKAKREAKKKAIEDRSLLVIQKVMDKFSDELLKMPGHMVNAFVYRLETLPREYSMYAFLERNLKRSNVSRNWLLGILYHGCENLISQVATVEVVWKNGNQVYNVISIQE